MHELEDAFELRNGDGSVVEDRAPQTATLAIAGFDASGPVAIYRKDGLTVFEPVGDE
ncbi:hypothetical protein ACLD0U_07635 [Microbacterium sp. 2216-1]|uniref:hypothetical protein n=1 Tax=Microbacterium sp. 2216-1 TaxID=3390053 RepID=UPI0039751DAF